MATVISPKARQRRKRAMKAQEAAWARKNGPITRTPAPVDKKEVEGPVEAES